jgi:hypothetical protein
VNGTAAEYIFETARDRYPVAAHLILSRDDGKLLLMRRTGTIYVMACSPSPRGMWISEKPLP